MTRYCLCFGFLIFIYAGPGALTKRPSYIVTPLNVHPPQRPLFYYVHCNVQTPDGTSRDSKSTLSQGWTPCHSDIASTLFLPGLLHLAPCAWHISHLFHTAPVPYCAISSLCDIFLVFFMPRLCHTVTVCLAEYFVSVLAVSSYEHQHFLLSFLFLKHDNTWSYENIKNENFKITL